MEKNSENALKYSKMHIGYQTQENHPHTATTHQLEPQPYKILSNNCDIANDTPMDTIQLILPVNDNSNNSTQGKLGIILLLL